MAKATSFYVCQNCEAEYPKWQGQCAQCGEWNTLVEQLKAKKTTKASVKGFSKRELDELVVVLPDVKPLETGKIRFSTSIGELDRVLGGGLVLGSVVLLGGEPGIGKSTLLTQMILGMSAQNHQHPKSKNKQQLNFGSVIYVAGEESPNQIKLRIKRILDNEDFISTHKVKNKDQLVSGEQLLLATSTDADQLVEIIKNRRPSLVIVDSIQTLSTQDLSGASGSVGQIRECTERLIETVKPRGIPVFLVGHVTKEGIIAGPKVLEHMVDTVLEISGERTGQLRLVRAVKNRFGATDEVGVFQVSDYGLAEVVNPSELFIEQAGQATPGSATICVMEGTRPLLLEVQALVVKSHLAMPRRVGRGVELSRIQVLAAVLQKHCRLTLGTADIFLSAAGGFKLREPAVDLGLSLAIASSLKNKKLPQKTVFIGEVGLLGEIRSVSYLDRRIREAQRLGFTRVISRQTHLQVKQVLQELGL